MKFFMLDFSLTLVIFQNELHMNSALCQLQTDSDSE